MKSTLKRTKQQRLFTITISLLTLTKVSQLINLTVNKVAILIKALLIDFKIRRKEINKILSFLLI